VTGGSAGASLEEVAGSAGRQEPQAGILRYIERIWHVRGSVELPPGQTGEEAFARLDPLFHEPGTIYERSGDTLIFAKKDPRAQDKMAVFDSGVLQVEAGALVPVMRYHLISRMLLFCFLMPLVFLGFAQLAIALGKADKPPAEAAAGKAGDKAKKPEKTEPELKLNPIDKFLGAPAPEKPDKDKKKGEKGKKGDKDEEQEKKPSPTPAYVFAGIFAALYVIGRWLEAWLVARLFRRRLATEESP
jgi:hypothetical protein